MITSEIDNLYYILLMQPTGILSVRNGGIFLENGFWTPPLLSILYMDLTESVST